MSMLGNWFKKKVLTPKFRFQEDVDYRILPDLEAAKRDDPHPWNIYFLNRMFKVHYIKVPDKPRKDGYLHVDIKAEVLYGKEFTTEENQQLGALLMELVQRNMLEKD